MEFSQYLMSDLVAMHAYNGSAIPAYRRSCVGQIGMLQLSTCQLEPA